MCDCATAACIFFMSGGCPICNNFFFRVHPEGTIRTAVAADEISKTQNNMKVLNFCSTVIGFFSIWIGAATMLMVATGMIGTLLLFQYRRRKNTAVSYFCGSTKQRIYAEQLVEIGAVLLFGTEIGLAIGFAVIRQGVFSYLMEIEWFYAVIVMRWFWMRKQSAASFTIT